MHVKAYASAEDFSKIKSGAKALISGTVVGTVTSVAPSVNQENKKVQIKVLVGAEGSSSLVIGQNVSVSIEAAAPAISTNQPSNNYLLPIQNVKIIPGAAYVFTVDSNSKIVKNPVIIGKVQGDFIEIISGITSSMKIVSPVYELEESMAVSIQE